MCFYMFLNSTNIVKTNDINNINLISSGNNNYWNYLNYAAISMIIISTGVILYLYFYDLAPNFDSFSLSSTTITDTTPTSKYNYYFKENSLNSLIVFTPIMKEIIVGMLLSDAWL